MHVRGETTFRTEGDDLKRGQIGNNKSTKYLNLNSDFEVHFVHGSGAFG